MNKIEKAALKGIKNSLASVRNHKDGDSWENYGARMQQTVRNSIDVLDELIALKTDEEKEDNSVTLN